VLVTSAARSRDEQIDARQRRYLLTMGLRTLLFVLAIVLFRGVWRYAAIGASLVLPWLAVVVANAGLAPGSEMPDYVAPTGGPELSSGAGKPETSGSDSSPEEGAPPLSPRSSP
jgi:hypothetical protein